MVCLPLQHSSWCMHALRARMYSKIWFMHVGGGAKDVTDLVKWHVEKELDWPGMTLVPRGSAYQCIFTHAANLKKGETSTLSLNSHPGIGIGKQYLEERRSGPWRFIESGRCAEGASIRVRYEDGKFIKLADDDLVFDVSHGRMEVGITVNYVGGTSSWDRTKQGGANRDWTINDDGTISAKHHPHLVLGMVGGVPPPAWEPPTQAGGGGGGGQELPQAQNDELHINPGCAPQYMSQLLWPETARGPAIPRKLAVRYSYGVDGPVHTVETPGKSSEKSSLW
jgi:hypothetical protein